MQRFAIFLIVLLCMAWSSTTYAKHKKPVAPVVPAPSVIADGKLPPACGPVAKMVTDGPNFGGPPHGGPGPMPGPHMGPMPGPHFGGGDFHGDGGWHGGGWNNWFNPLPFVAPLVINYATQPRMVINPITGQSQLMSPGQWILVNAGTPQQTYTWQPLPAWPLLSKPIAKPVAQPVTLPHPIKRIRGIFARLFRR